MIVGSIAPHTSEAAVDVLAICHQPCWLLYVHTIDFRNHAEHAEVEISKSCTRKLAQRILEFKQHDGGLEWADWMTQHEQPLKATVATDTWAFGVLLYRLCVEDSAHIFLSTEAGKPQTVL